MVVINLLCMWKVSNQIEKEKEKKLEVTLARKLEKARYSNPMKRWRSKATTAKSGQQSTSRGQLSIVLRKQEDKSPATPLYHTSFGEDKFSNDNNRTKQPKASSEWPTKQVSRFYFAPSSL